MSNIDIKISNFAKGFLEYIHNKTNSKFEKNKNKFHLNNKNPEETVDSQLLFDNGFFIQYRKEWAHKKHYIILFNPKNQYK